MPQLRSKGLSIRSTGLVVALGVFLIGAGVLGLLAMRGRAGRSAIGPAGPIAPVMPPTPVDITQVGLKNAGRARIQFVDRNDPSRVVGTLEWESLNPSGPGRAVVNEPRAIVYLRDGRTLNVTAKSGEIVSPSGPQSQPESGTFSGGVTISLTDGPSGMGGPDESTRDATAAPALRLFTPSLAFNLVLGEVTTDDRFRLSSAQVETAGQGLRLVGNQAESTLSLQIDQTDYFWFAPVQGAPGKAARAPDAGGSKPTGPGKEIFYAAAVRDNIILVRRGLTLTAARLEAWARLVDNTLGPAALGPPQPKTPEAIARADQPPKAPAAAFRTPTPTRSKAIPGEPESLFAGLEDPNLVVANWTGPLVVAPVAARPAGLETEDVRGAFTGAEGAPVRLEDVELGASASAASIGYGATTSTIRIQADQANPDDRAELALKDKGALQVRDASLNLRTGVGFGEGATRLIAGDSRPERPRTIDASRRTDFALATRAGWIGDKLRTVVFSGPDGGVLARDGASTFQGDAVRVEFIGAANSTGPLEGQIAGIVAEGHVVATDSSGGELRGRKLSVAFEPAPNGKSSDPTGVIAEGDVAASRDGWSILSQSLNASLERDERNDIVVKSAQAEGGARVSGRGVSARADQIRADVAHQLIDLLGQDVTLARDGGTIGGTQMQLNGHREELFVFGPGWLEYDSPPASPRAPAEGPLASPAPGSRPQHVKATWTKSMSFNNLDGKAACVGGVEVASKAAEDELDTLRADRVELAFTPGRAMNPPGLAAPALPSERSEPEPARRLLKAEAIGESLEREGGSKAMIESRRFAPLSESMAGSERPLERLVYVEGDRIIADEERHEMSVPSAGRLLVDDRRAGPPKRAATESPARGAMPSDLSGARGTTLFKWAASLRFTRTDGVLKMADQVRIFHRAGAGEPVTSIDADAAEAVLRTPGANPGGDEFTPGQQVELRSATASGNVSARAENGPKLTADSVSFQAGRQTLEASASPPNRVVLDDPKTPTPVLARRLLWDIPRQRWTILEPSTIVAPVGK